MDPSSSEPQVNLQQLIKRRKAALDLTYDEMIKRVEAAGLRIARSTLHTIASTSWANIPNTETILAIAVAIGTEPDEVLTAAALSVGIRPTFVQVDDSTRAVVAMIQNRPADQRQSVEDVVRTVTRAMDSSAAVIPPA